MLVWNYYLYLQLTVICIYLCLGMVSLYLTQIIYTYLMTGFINYTVGSCLHALINNVNRFESDIQHSIGSRISVHILKDLYWHSMYVIFSYLKYMCVLKLLDKFWKVVPDISHSEVLLIYPQKIWICISDVISRP